MNRLALLLAALLTQPALAQKVSSFERGSQAYRAVLNRCGLRPLDHVQQALDDPSHSVIILFGRLGIYEDQFSDNKLKRFLQRGGAVLFASDVGWRGEMWDQIEIGVNGNIVVAPTRDPSTTYRGELVECPLLQQPKRANVKSKLNLLGPLRVATNRPSFLNRMPLPSEAGMGDGAQRPKLNQERVIAELPTGSVLAEILAPPLQVPENRLLLAVADKLGRGRYAVFADHTMFLNVMMLQEDNDNITFALQMTRWLTEDGKRTQVHFADDGIVRTDFSLNIDYVDPPLPHPDVFGPMVDQLMESLERDNFFNKGIERLVPPYRILRTSLLLLTVFASVAFLCRVVSRRFRADPRVARLPDRLDVLATGPSDKISGTLPAIAAAARELARGSLEQLSHSPLDVNNPPMLRGDATWAARIHTIWEVAAGRSRRVNRPAHLEQLARELVDLQKAAERGDVTLTAGANG